MLMPSDVEQLAEGSTRLHLADSVPGSAAAQDDEDLPASAPASVPAKKRKKADSQVDAAADQGRPKPKRFATTTRHSGSDEEEESAPGPSQRKATSSSHITSKTFSTASGNVVKDRPDWREAMRSRATSSQQSAVVDTESILPPQQLAALAAERRRAGVLVGQEASQRQSRAPDDDPLYDEAPFQYFFIDDLGMRTQSITMAESKLAPRTQTTLVRIEYLSSQALHPIAKHVSDLEVQDEVAGQPATEQGFVPRAQVARVAPGITHNIASFSSSFSVCASVNQNSRQSSSIATEVKPAKRGDVHIIPSSDSLDLPQTDPFSFQESSYSRSASASRTTSCTQSQSQPVGGQAAAPKAPLRATSSTTTTASSSRAVSTSRTTLQDTAAHSLPPVSASDADCGAASSSQPYPQSELVTMRPGDYKVCLAIDHRERKSANELEMIVDGVETLVLPLLLGDAVWIAVRKEPSAKPEHDMIVLDGALERKRLDDLISSIQDKRYEDQKARFRQTGFTRFYYLLEHYKDSRLLETYEQQMWTVRSQTQIMDNFVILTAKSNTEAVQQHRMLTNAMAQAYEGKTLYGLKVAHTNRQLYLSQLAQLQEAQPDRDYLPTYECFQHVNQKQHTVKSGWAQMLFAQAGMSAEKTAALVEVWPTAAHFWQDLKTQQNLVESLPPDEPEDGGGASSGRRKKKKGPHPGETFVKERCSTGGTRDIGAALSKSLWELWTKETY